MRQATGNGGARDIDRWANNPTNDANHRETTRPLNGHWTIKWPFNTAWIIIWLNWHISQVREWSSWHSWSGECITIVNIPIMIPIITTFRRIFISSIILNFTHKSILWWVNWQWLMPLSQCLFLLGLGQCIRHQHECYDSQMLESARYCIEPPSRVCFSWPAPVSFESQTRSC